MKRLFVAIKIDPDPGFLTFYRSLKNSLGAERIKWVEEHNLHITLKFLGETPEGLIPKTNNILAEYTRGLSRFNFQLKGLGVFGSRFAPRVIWTGLEPFMEITGMMHDIQRDFMPIGFEKDRQNHVPHLTLGRVHSLRDRILFQQLLDQHKGFSGAVHLVDCLILYESILKQDGPEYRIIQKYLFGKKDQG
ncbi:MAG: RNA 2',3'-cyclic phosphodiesterase [bacterium]